MPTLAGFYVRYIGLCSGIFRESPNKIVYTLAGPYGLRWKRSPRDSADRPPEPEWHMTHDFLSKGGCFAGIEKAGY